MSASLLCSRLNIGSIQAPAIVHSMNPENRGRRRFPDWALRERQSDMDWIGENFHVFWPAATAAFAEQGRGALVVDTTSRPTGKGNPFAYLPQEVVDQRDDEDIKRMVREYDPEREFVVVLLKSRERTSTYRVQERPRADPDRTGKKRSK